MPINPGFSAVELLLVAGIIAILVAIAVPGYLEAKVRAEIADVNNTLTLVHHALIQYKVEYNQFPEKPLLVYGYPNPLTRLVNTQFLPTEPLDRFKERLKEYGEYYSDPLMGYDYMDPNKAVFTKIFAKVSANAKNMFVGSKGNEYWFIKSIGPDQIDYRDEGGGKRISHNQNMQGIVDYNPTNGVFSLGEITLTP